MKGIRLKIGVVVVAIVAAPAVALANPVSSGAPEPPASQPSSSATAHPRLPTIPRQARVTIDGTRGAGDSEVFEFTPTSETYTMAITCTSTPLGAGAQIYDLGYPEDPIAVTCDGVPNSWVVGGTTDTQHVQVRAPAGVNWVFSIYDGEPTGVSVKSRN